MIFRSSPTGVIPEPPINGIRNIDGVQLLAQGRSSRYRRGVGFHSQAALDSIGPFPNDLKTTHTLS